MQTATIMQGARYRLDSAGNGLFYTLHDTKTRRSVFLQGDDAAQFRDDLDKAEDFFPHEPTDSILGAFWSEYEAVSAPNEDAQES